MINTLTNPTMLMTIGVIFVYIIAVITVIRGLRLPKSKPYIHNEYTKVNKKLYDYVITSNSCPICERIDIIHIDEDMLDDLTKDSNIDVGEYLIHHIGKGEPHQITHYIDSYGIYIDYQIPPSDIKRHLENTSNITNT